MVPSISDKNLRGLVNAVSIPIGSHRNDELIRLILRTPEVFNFLLSIPLSSLSIRNFMVKNNNMIPNNNFVEVLSAVVYYASINDSTQAKRVVKETSLLYQQVIQVLLTSKMKAKLPELLLLETMSDLFTKSEIIKFLPVPIANTVSTSILEAMEKKSGEVEYPVKVISLNRKFAKETLFYLKRRGSIITSNSTFKDAKKKIVALLPSVDMGCIFTTHKVSGKAHSRGVKILLQGDPKVVAKIFRGTEVDISSLEYPDEENTTTVYNDEELLNVITTQNNNYTNYLISSKGMVKVVYKEYIKVAYVTDYILDDSFEPVGLNVDFEGTIYPLSIKQHLLEDINIRGLSVKIKVRYYKGKIVSMSFMRFRKD